MADCVLQDYLKIIRNLNPLPLSDWPSQDNDATTRDGIRRTLMAVPAIKSLAPFHLAFPVNDLEQARAFYGGILCCPEGRSSSEWIDFDFFGHQIVAHLAPEIPKRRASNNVDNNDVPVPHFGIVLSMSDWETLAAHLTTSGITFVIEPHVRFKGQPGEQATMFFLDPFGNALEFKAFQNIERLFAK